LEEYEIDTMINVALVLVPLWENALGKNWKQKITRDKLKSLYKKM
jgi:3-deoxy-alpha-D-manno-octulosonate 8-oxidase